MSKKVQLLKKEIKEAKQDTSDKIEKLLDNNPNGPFTHNLIGMYLRGLSEKTGCYKASNELIHEFGIDELYGIYPIEEE